MVLDWSFCNSCNADSIYHYKYNWNKRNKQIKKGHKVMENLYYIIPTIIVSGTVYGIYKLLMYEYGTKSN